MIAFFVVVPFIANAQTMSDYLILNDIGSYKLSKPVKPFPGFKPTGGPRTYEGAGVLSGAGHFDDHKDMSYKVMYLGGDGLPSPTVLVVQHAGADSDQWLLHEIEDAYRDGNDKENRLGLIAQGTRIRDIDGNKIIGMRGGGYNWISNNILVDISYTDLDGSKPEPLEVIKAYLAKHPSTVPAITIDDAHNKKWIKDEMERRLWLCGKWYMQVQLEKATLSEASGDVYDYLEIFINYREKYFKVDAKADREALAIYKSTKNHTALKAKYEALKQWWDDNKDEDIDLP
jgi:hypothetical protein